MTGMAMGGDRVFISYSRHDYYLAESLSLQLAQRGVPAWMDVLELRAGSDWEALLFEAIDGCAAFVLVASPAALASPHVRAEWQRALARGRRVLLLGWHRRVRLPVELQGCEWLDFRGRFAPALVRLVALLGLPSQHAPQAGARPGRGPWAPPAVLAVMAALALPIAAYAYGVASDVATLDFADDSMSLGLGAGAGLLLFTAFSVVVIWALWLSLLQRRMGMTRLMLCLGFVATPFALTAWKVAQHGPEGLQGTPVLVAQRALQHLPWVWLLAALPLLAMAWCVWARPLGLLHWMPTGKAWDRMRRGVAPASSAALPADALAAVQRFRLLHDAPDRPLAEWLRDALHRQGAVEGAGPGTSLPGRPKGELRSAQHEGTSVITVLLLSNRSGRDWLARQPGLQGDPALRVVVGSAISLMPQLDWLWRRQWIDLRRGRLAPAVKQARLPALPEAVSQQRLAAPLAYLHALLCAFGVLAGLLGYLLTPTAMTAADEASVPMVLGAGLGGATVWCARRVLRRELPQAALKRWLAIGLPLGTVFAGVAAAGPDLSFDARVAGVIGALAAAALAALAWRLWPQVQPWLPDASPRLPPAQCLAPPRDWRTSLTVLAFLFAWLLPVQLFAPQLMGP